MNHLYIRVTDKGMYQCYRSVNGIYAEVFGPGWPTPKEASRYLHTLEDMPDVSPLRTLREGQDGSGQPLDPAPLGSPDVRTPPAPVGRSMRRSLRG